MAAAAAGNVAEMSRFIGIMVTADKEIEETKQNLIDFANSTDFGGNKVRKFADTLENKLNEILGGSNEEVSNLVDS